MHQPPAGTQRAPRLVCAEAGELATAPAGLGALKPVLRDGVTCADALGQPPRELGPRIGEGVQLGGRRHEQRDAVDAKVVQPVADQRTALERRRLDVMQRERDAVHCSARALAWRHTSWAAASWSRGALRARAIAPASELGSPG